MAMASSSPSVVGTEPAATHLLSQGLGHFLNALPPPAGIEERNPGSTRAPALGARRPGAVVERRLDFGPHPKSPPFRQELRNAGIRESVSEGMLLHARIMYMGYGTDVLLCNLLIQMYGRCRCKEEAHWVFDSMPDKNVFTWALFMGVLIGLGMIDSAWDLFKEIPDPDTASWNLLISGFSQHERDQEALDLFDSMVSRGFEPDAFTFVSVLAACAHLGDVEKCRKMHVFLASYGFDSDQSLSGALINMYSKCCSLEDTKRVFGKIDDRTFGTWNALISVYAKNGNVAEAFKIFDQMRCCEAIPDEITYVTLLNACACKKKVGYGRKIHACIVDAGIESDVLIGNAVISMYGHCRSLDDGVMMFNRMRHRNVVSWNAMITIHSKHRPVKESVDMLSQMELEGIEPNDVTFIALLDACASQEALDEGNKICARLCQNACRSNIVVMTAALNMYGKCETVVKAREIFDAMDARDVIAWNAMMASYVQCGRFPEACLLFKRMLRDVSDVKPDNVTFANVLVATAEQLAFEEGRIIHAHIIGNGLEHDLLVGNSLINMYSKFGNMQMARIEFNKLSRRDVVSWNALMAGYGQHGEGEQALHLLQEMQMYGNAPNEVTFLSILSSCDHSGLVDEANRCFASMEELYQVRPLAGHYNVLVNLLGRAGRLEDAREIIKEMPMDPVATTWMGLLGACRKHRDLRRGIESASHIFSLDALYDAAFVTLSNLQIECDTNMHE